MHKYIVYPALALLALAVTPMAAQAGDWRNDRHHGRDHHGRNDHRYHRHNDHSRVSFFFGSPNYYQPRTRTVYNYVTVPQPVYIPTPTPVYYSQANNSYCREFTRTITIGGIRQQGYGNACQQADGSWQIAD